MLLFGGYSSDKPLHCSSNLPTHVLESSLPRWLPVGRLLTWVRRLAPLIC